MLQLLTLNHPVDCGICDKAGECTLQDYHYKYNGAPSVSRDAEGALRPSSTRSPSASCSTTSAASCARAACASRARSRSRTRSASRSAATHRCVARRRRPVARRRPVLGQRHRPLPGRRAAVARRSCTRRGSGISSRRPRSARAARAAARVQIWHRKTEWKLNALDPATERQHRPRHAARESGGQRSLDLQQGARPRADLRAAARGRRRCTSGAAGRSLEPAIDARARPDRAGAQHPVALVSSWGSNEELDAFKARSARASRVFVKQDCVAAARRAARGRSADPGRQEPEQLRRRERCSRWTTLTRRVRRRHTIWSWSGARASTSPGCRPRARDPSSSMRTRSRTNGTPTCSSRISIQTERSGHYTQLRGRGAALRAVLRQAAAVADAETLFAAIGGCRPQGSRGRMIAGPRRLRRLHRLRDRGAAAVRHRAAPGSSASRRRSCPTASAPTAPTCAFRSRSIKLVWLGPVPRPRRRPQDDAEGGLQAASPTTASPTPSRRGSCSRRCCWSSRSFPSAARSSRASSSMRAFPSLAAWFGDRTLPDADRAARCRPAGRASRSAA